MRALLSLFCLALALPVLGVLGASDDGRGVTGLGRILPEQGQTMLDVANGNFDPRKVFKNTRHGSGFPQGLRHTCSRAASRASAFIGPQDPAA